MAFPTLLTSNVGYGDTLSFGHEVDVVPDIALLDADKFPLTTILLNNNSASPAINPQFDMLFDALNPEWFTVNESTTKATSATTFNVDDASGIRIGDILEWYKPGTYQPETEQLLVTGISTNTLTATRAFRFYTGSTRSTIPDESLLHRVGQAIGDKATLSNLVTNQARVMPWVQVTNYCELFIDVLPISLLEQKTKHRGTSDARAYEQRKMMQQVKREMENAFLWGVAGTEAAISTYPGTDFTTGGLYYWINRVSGDSAIYAYPGAGGTIQTQTDLTGAEFRSFITNLFKHGSTEKMLFVSGLLAEAIDSWNLQSVRSSPGNDYFGVKTQRYETSHGVLHIKRHWMLDNPPLSTLATTNLIGNGGFAFAVDMNDIRLRYVNDMSLKLYMDVGVKGDLVKTDQVFGQYGLEVRQPSSHGVIRAVQTYSGTF